MTTTAAKPARELTYDRMTGMLRLTVGRSVEAYSLHVLPGEGATQVALHKFAAADETRYVVTVGGDVAVCNCPAGRWNKPCKHKSAVVVLLARGLLTAAE